MIIGTKKQNKMIFSPHNEGATFFEKHPFIPPFNLTFTFELLVKSKKFGNQIAIICDGVTATYDQFIDDYTELSKAFKELGVRKGEIVTVPLPNNYQAICTLFALNKIGAVTTFIDTYASESEVCDYINLYQSPILVNFDKSFEENEAIKKKTGVKYIITLSSGLVNQRLLNLDYRSKENNPKEYMLNYHSLGSIATFKRNLMFLPQRGNLDALILYTSGSTGFPKSVVLTNKNIWAAQIYAKNTSHTENIHAKSTMTCVPLRYPYGCVTSLLTSLFWGKTAYMTPNWNSTTARGYLEKYRPNIIFGSPSVIDLMMKLPDDFDLSFLELFISGGDFLTPALYDKFKKYCEIHGAPEVAIGNGQGNAETVSIASTPVGVKSKPSTAGKVLVGTKAIIIDGNIPSNKPIKDGNSLDTLPIGQVGEFCQAGKHVFKEYFKDPKSTELAKFKIGRNTYFRSGTIGFFDEDGYFTPTNRKSRFYINDGGFKVYLDYVQGVISTACSDLLEVAVVPVQDVKKRFCPVAYVSLHQCNNLVTEDELETYCKEKLNAPVEYLGKKVQLKEYEIPVHFVIIESMPRIPGSDKISYAKLEEDAAIRFPSDDINLHLEADDGTKTNSDKKRLNFEKVG